jgi:hypothetical protein
MPGGLAGPVPSDQDALADRFKGPGVRHDQDRATGGNHNVLGTKSRGTVRPGTRRTLTGNRQIDRFCELDQRRRVAISQKMPLALDTVKPQLALEVHQSRPADL